MIEVGGCPAAGRVTGAALARKVIGGFIAGMARRAIRQAGVIEVSWLPRSGVVAGAALPRKVIGGLVGRVA